VIAVLGHHDAVSRCRECLPYLLGHEDCVIIDEQQVRHELSCATVIARPATDSPLSRAGWTVRQWNSSLHETPRATGADLSKKPVRFPAGHDAVRTSKKRSVTRVWRSPSRREVRGHALVPDIVQRLMVISCVLTAKLACIAAYIIMCPRRYRVPGRPVAIETQTGPPPPTVVAVRFVAGRPAGRRVWGASDENALAGAMGKPSRASSRGWICGMRALRRAAAGGVADRGRLDDSGALPAAFPECQSYNQSYSQCHERLLCSAR